MWYVVSLFALVIMCGCGCEHKNAISNKKEKRTKQENNGVSSCTTTTPDSMARSVQG
jgi:hypothetical protein